MNSYHDTCEMALTEMFRRVGEEYTVWKGGKCTVDAEWYTRCSWTEAEAADFRAWLVALLRKKHKMVKKKAETEAAWFDLMWGWKVKDDTSKA